MAQDIARNVVRMVHEMNEEQLKARRADITMCAPYSEEKGGFREFYLEFSFVSPNSTRVRLMLVCRFENVGSEGGLTTKLAEGEEIRRDARGTRWMREKKQVMVVQCLLRLLFDRSLVHTQSVVEDVCYTVLNMLGQNAVSTLYATLDSLGIPRSSGFDDIPRWAQPVVCCTGMWDHSLAVDPRCCWSAETTDSNRIKQMHRWCRTLLLTI